MKISARIEIFKEGDVFVALSPELNVSSFGATVQEAKDSINNFGVNSLILTMRER